MVKHFKILSLLFLFSLLTFKVSAQDVQVQLKDAIETQNIKTFAKLFDERIEINLNGKVRDYSQIQAQVVLNKFLNKFKSVSFKMMHHGNSESQSKYYIGEMEADGDKYQVYVYLKKINNNDFIQEIKFEKQGS